MRLGGFVLFGNNRDTVGAAASSLLAICDDVIAVDSGATDGSRAIVENLGVRCLDVPWQGYGFARAAAVEALAGNDYVMFVDSDEFLTESAIVALKAWLQTPRDGAGYRIRVNDWVESREPRFLFRSSGRLRIIRYDRARYRPSMIVHESVGLRRTKQLDGVTIEHRFVSSAPRRVEKERTYALLWAVQSFVERRVGWRWPALQRAIHFMRDAIWRGAAFRGGRAGLSLAWELANHSKWKHEYLAAIRAGQHQPLVTAFREQRWSDLFLAASNRASDQ